MTPSPPSTHRPRPILVGLAVLAYCATPALSHSRGTHRDTSSSATAAAPAFSWRDMETQRTMTIFADDDRRDETSRALQQARRWMKEEDKKEEKPKKTDHPTYQPTEEEEEDKKEPKPKKTDAPTFAPTASHIPTAYPTVSFPPTFAPVTIPPTVPTPGTDALDTPSPATLGTEDTLDTLAPAVVVTEGPTEEPTEVPSGSPTERPSGMPSESPTRFPTISPTPLPSVSFNPTAFPSSSPTISTQPTISPTGMPSASPSSHPTGMPSSSPTDSAMPSSAPIPYTRSGRVELRHTPWSKLPAETQTSASQLGYDETTWNDLGVNPVENLDWVRLSREQKNAARQLGYDADSWDCWQNHYQSYRWIDLDRPYVQAGQWWEILGWDIYSWNRQKDGPGSDDLLWFELDDVQRYAAAQLCYFRTAWDEGPVLYGGFPVERPEFRYGDWMELGKDARELADVRLKYSPLTWNVLGLDGIEAKGWAGLTEYEVEAASGIGFTEDSWDCWQNHYRGYSWEDLVFYGLDIPYLTLGWTELSWDGIENAPASMDKTWKELSQEERQLASELCYFRDNWDGLDMTPNNGPFLYPKVKQRYVEWRSLPGDIRRAARDSLLYTKESWNNLGTADVEKRSWDELSDQQKSDAIHIGFYQRSWDCFHNHYRSYAWYDLERDSQDALQFLGWNKESWENNDVPPSYDNEWDRLSEKEQSFATTLCLFEDNWNGNNLEVVGEDILLEEEEDAEISVPGDGGEADSTDGPGTQVPVPTQNVDKVNEALNPTDPTNCAGMMRTRIMLFVGCVIFGTWIQLVH